MLSKRSSSSELHSAEIADMLDPKIVRLPFSIAPQLLMNGTEGSLECCGTNDASSFSFKLHSVSASIVFLDFNDRWAGLIGFSVVRSPNNLDWSGFELKSTPLQSKKITALEERG